MADLRQPGQRGAEPELSDAVAVAVTDAVSLAAARRRSRWPELVAYTSTRTAGEVGPADVYADGVYPQSEAEWARSFGVALQGGVCVTLPNPLPGGLGKPKPRDVITWRGDAYTVTSVVNAYGFRRAPFWKVYAFDKAIAADLGDTLTVRRLARSPGAGGLAVAGAAAVVWSGLGRVQVTQAQAEPATAGRLTTRYLGVAFLGTADPAADAGDVVDQADGTRWEVKGVRDIDVLDRYVSVDVERLA